MLLGMENNEITKAPLLSTNSTYLLGQLAKEIDRAIEQVNQENKKDNNNNQNKRGGFVKLSSRSPKDSTVTGDKTKRIFW